MTRIFLLPKLWRLRRSLEDGAWRLLFSGRGYAATDSSRGWHGLALICLEDASLLFSGRRGAPTGYGLLAMGRGCEEI